MNINVKQLWLFKNGSALRIEINKYINISLHVLFLFFFKLFLYPGSRTPSRVCTLFTIFGRMQGIEPELLRPQPGVLPMSYTHPYIDLHVVQYSKHLRPEWMDPYSWLCSSLSDSHSSDLPSQPKIRLKSLLWIGLFLCKGTVYLHTVKMVNVQLKSN